jgi:hypothetical protein
MLKYPSVSIPFFFYTWSWTFINILPAVSMAKIYASVYGFKSGTIGLCTGIPLIIGCLVGELTGGRLSDYILLRRARGRGGVFKPEDRLYLTCLSAIAGPVGMVIFGVCLSKKAYFVVPLVGLGVGEYINSPDSPGSECCTDGLRQACMVSKSRRLAYTPTSRIATDRRRRNPPCS